MSNILKVFWHCLLGYIRPRKDHVKYLIMLLLTPKEIRRIIDTLKDAR